MRDTVVFIRAYSGCRSGPGIAGDQLAQVCAIAMRTDPSVKEWRELRKFEAQVQFDAHDTEPHVLASFSYDTERWRKQAMHESIVLRKLAAFLGQHRADGSPLTRLAGHRLWETVGALGLAFEQRRMTLPLHHAQLDVEQGAAWLCESGAYRLSDFSLPSLIAGMKLPYPEGLTPGLAEVALTVEVARWLLSRVPRG